MQIERAISGIKTLGPGSRFVVWVNGCNRHCDGCVSERLQKFEPRNEQDVITYLDGFDFRYVDGVTISGGEPFEQANDLLQMVRYFKKIGIDDILIYTGYTIDELHKKHDEKIESILSEIAVLIDGPYMQELNNDLGNLKGSDNQRVIFLNDRFKLLYDSYFCEERKMQELQIGNYIIAAGIPTKQYILEFVSGTKQNGG